MKFRVPNYPIHPRKGFSLVEILAVMFIIVILLTFIVSSFNWVETSKRERTAQVFVQRISTALEEYQLDNGAYPDGNGAADSTNAIYKALFSDHDEDGIPDKDPETNTRLHVYVEELNPLQHSGSEPTVAKHNKKYCLIDPWGTPYRYRLGFQEKDSKGAYGNGYNPDFDFWSVGKDGLDNTKLGVAEGVNADNIGNM